MEKARFELGTLLMTRGVNELVQENGAMDDLMRLVAQHATGDWGIVCEEDSQANEDALASGDRLLSAYQLAGVKVWIITEAIGADGKREATTVLLPEEY